MRLLPAIIGAALAFPLPALATSSLVCESSSGASIELAVGTVGVAAVANATITIGEKIISMVDGDIIVGQQYADDGQFLVDFTDSNVEKILAKLRLFSATEGEYFALAGTLHVLDIGAYAVTCSEF